MTTLTLADTQTAILAAFNRWLDQNTNSFDVQLSVGPVRVNVEKREHSFDCGMPGYDMGNSDVAALQSWVSNHVKDQTGVGVLTSCKNVSGTGVVNALFRAATNFNFHVNLTGPC